MIVTVIEQECVALFPADLDEAELLNTIVEAIRTGGRIYAESSDNKITLEFDGDPNQLPDPVPPVKIHNPEET